MHRHDAEDIYDGLGFNKPTRDAVVERITDAFLAYAHPEDEMDEAWGRGHSEGFDEGEEQGYKEGFEAGKRFTAKEGTVEPITLHKLKEDKQ